MIKTGDKGFTLLEVLVASAIFTFGMLAILGMLVTSMGGNAEGRQISEAGKLAASKLDDLRLTAYKNLTSGTGSEPEFINNSSVNDSFTRTWTVYTDIVPNMNIKRAVVTVSWKSKGIPHSVTLQTLIAKQ